jgi:hypothetical protein
MTLEVLRKILREGQELGTVDWIYYEGGEPFLYYPILVKGVREAVDMGFKVGIVTNSYWATGVEDAVEWLKPFTGLIQDLSISNDLYHWSTAQSEQVQNAQSAAEQLGIPIGTISVAQPEGHDSAAAVGQLPPGESSVMYRGRAAVSLIDRAGRTPWTELAECPYENLRDPGRVHVDPFGNLHLCQGIVLGNLFHTPLREICETYIPDSHPIAGPLLQGGPAALVEQYQLPHLATYADACHLCYEARIALRTTYPNILLPDQMYGVPE